MITLALVATVLLVLLCALLLLSEAAEVALLLKGAAIARWPRISGFHTGDALLKSPLAPGVAVITVPPDASEASRLSVRSLLKMRAADAEIVVVLNGFTDAERAAWVGDFQLEATQRVPDRPAPGQECWGVYRSRGPISLLVIGRLKSSLADCLNTAVAFAQAPVIAFADEAAEVSEEALLRSLEEFMAGPERSVALCVAGPAASSPGLPARLYQLGFLRIWLNRCALGAWNAALPAPGGLTLFDRDAVLRLGGFRGGVLEMVVRLHRMLRAAGSRERIGFLPLAVVRPRAPRSWKEFRAARARIRAEERQAIPVSGLIHHYYFRPLAGLAVAVLSSAAYWFGWVEPSVLVRIVGGTIAFRLLSCASTVLLGEFASPVEGGPGDLACLFLTAVTFWTE